MTFFTNLFGDGPLGTIIAAVIGLLILGLIVVVIYRLTVGRGLRTAPGGRARQPRLGIVDAFDLDRQRQLVLVRRDNVEHLIMIGGPNDLLIEPAIVRAQPSSSAEPARREAAQPPLAPAANGGPERAAPRLQPYEQGRDAEKSYEETAREFAPQREAPQPPRDIPAPREVPVQRELPPQRDMPAQRELPSQRDLTQRAPPLDAPLPREPATREPPPFAAPPRPPFGQPAGSEGVSSSPSLRPMPPAARPVPPPPPPRNPPPPPRPAPPSRGPAAAPPPPAQPAPPPEAPPARAPEQAPPPRLSVDIDSLEEEMAKLLGRPASEPKN